MTSAMANSMTNSMASVQIQVSALLLASGVACGVAHGEEPMGGFLATEEGQIVQVAHIYYNAASGERVITLAGGVDGIGRGGEVGLDDSGPIEPSGPIWSAMATDPCPAAGDNGGSFFVVDDNSPGGMTGFEVVDFGDIALDSVVDMVHIEWITGHSDVDINSDGIGDGVVGLGGQWTYWDADNGRAGNVSTRLPLISILFADLPGNIFGDGFLAGYTADIDLRSIVPEDSLTFELGDSDGVSTATYFHNDVDTDGDGIGDGVSVANADRDHDGLPDSDLDGDGLFDWSWSVRFYQPGTADLDGDGVIDGDFADSQRPIGISFARPDGVWVEQNDGSWTWEMPAIVPGDYGYGAEDAFATYFDGLYAGFYYGSFSCSPDGFMPMAQFRAQLIGPGGVGCCIVDMNCDGELNFFDISKFLALFAGEDPDADFNDDGQFNFFDISAFLAAFGVGCP